MEINAQVCFWLGQGLSDPTEILADIATDSWQNRDRNHGHKNRNQCIFDQVLTPFFSVQASQNFNHGASSFWSGVTVNPYDNAAGRHLGTLALQCKP